MSVLGPAPGLQAQEPFSGRDLRTENAALHRIVDSLKRVIARFEGVLDPWDRITGKEEVEGTELGYGISSLDEIHAADNAPSWLREADPEMGLEYRDEIEGRISGYRRRASSLGYAIAKSTDVAARVLRDQRRSLVGPCRDAAEAQSAICTQRGSVGNAFLRTCEICRCTNESGGGGT